MKKLITDETHKKVYFIGGDYEVVISIIVEAKTNKQAIYKAIESYNAYCWDFDYWRIEVAKCLKDLLKA